MALLVAVGALMHVFAVRIGAGTVIFIVQNAVIGSWPCAWASCMVVEGACWSRASGLVRHKWRRGCILEKAWAIKGVVPPIHLADGAPGGCLAMICKCVGISGAGSETNSWNCSQLPTDGIWYHTEARRDARTFYCAER